MTMPKLAFIALIIGTTLARAEDFVEAPITAVQSMNKALEAENYDEFYEKWCHPDFSDRFSKESFVVAMKGAAGKHLLKLFAAVDNAIEAKASEDVLVSRLKAPMNEYTFALAKAGPRSDRGILSTIKLKLDNQTWKLADTD